MPNHLYRKVGTVMQFDWVMVVCVMFGLLFIAGALHAFTKGRRNKYPPIIAYSLSVILTVAGLGMVALGIIAS